jgi:hypothetical protein
MEQFIIENKTIFLLMAVLWTLPWKAWALWKSARSEQKWWFLALLVINTLGLLEIAYIFVFSKKSLKIK